MVGEQIMKGFLACNRCRLCASCSILRIAQFHTPVSCNSHVLSWRSCDVIETELK